MRIETLTTLFDRLGSDAYSPPAVVVELLLIALSVNWCFGVLQGTRGTRPLRGVLVILVVATLVVRVLAVQFGWDRLDLLYRYFLYGLAFIAVVVFQPELRRAVIRAGDVRVGSRRAGAQSDLISALTKSAAYLSKNRYGALMAIQRTVDLRGWAENGTIINAEVTQKLLNQIFYPNSPLHDLGVIIVGSRVLAANCQFPIADSEEINMSLGSRHLAAIGMSYESDALVVVVSEETGRVSLADSGKLIRLDTPEMLADELAARLKANGPAQAHGATALRKRIWRHVTRTAVVLSMTVAIWYRADQATMAEARGVSVELTIKHPDPSHWLIDNIDPGSRRFSAALRGTTQAIDRLRRDTGNRPLTIDWVLEPDVARPGHFSRAVRDIIERRLLSQRGLEVASVTPAEISFDVDEAVTVEMPIKLDSPGQRLAVEKVEPATAMVTFRKRDLAQLPEAQRVVKAVIDEARLRALKPNQTETLKAALPTDRIGSASVFQIEPREAVVTVRSLEKVQSRKIGGIVVHYDASPETLKLYNVERADSQEWLIEIEVKGEAARVETLKPQDVRAFVTIGQDLVTPTPEMQTAPVTILLPQGVELSSKPPNVQLRLVPRKEGVP